MVLNPACPPHFNKHLEMIRVLLLERRWLHGPTEKHSLLRRQQLQCFTLAEHGMHTERCFTDTCPLEQSFGLAKPSRYNICQAVYFAGLLEAARDCRAAAGLHSPVYAYGWLVECSHWSCACPVSGASFHAQQQQDHLPCPPHPFVSILHMLCCWQHAQHCCNTCHKQSSYQSSQVWRKPFSRTMHCKMGECLLLS